MKTKRISGRTAGATAVGVALVMTSGAYALAAPNTTAFGAEQHIADANGSVGGYTVTDVRPGGSKTMNVPLTGEVRLSGELWFAPTTVSAVKGEVVPAMKSFNARTDGGQNYPVLVQALAPDLDVFSTGPRPTLHRQPLLRRHRARADVDRLQRRRAGSGDLDRSPLTGGPTPSGEIETGLVLLM